jgi:hypothetical protein
MRKIPIALAVAAVIAMAGGAPIAATASQAATGQADASTQATVPAAHLAKAVSQDFGCASEDVCMYTDEGWLNNEPEHQWITYGCYRLSGEFGDRVVYNNQIDGATATLYTDYNCTVPSPVQPNPIQEGNIWEGDITPINSISLNP